MSDVVLARLSVCLVLCPVKIEVARNRDIAVLLMPMLTPTHCRVVHVGGVIFAKGSNEDQQHTMQKLMILSMRQISVRKRDHELPHAF